MSQKFPWIFCKIEYRREMWCRLYGNVTMNFFRHYLQTISLPFFEMNMILIYLCRSKMANFFQSFGLLRYAAINWETYSTLTWSLANTLCSSWINSSRFRGGIIVLGSSYNSVLFLSQSEISIMKSFDFLYFGAAAVQFYEVLNTHSVQGYNSYGISLSSCVFFAALSRNTFSRS